MLLRAVALTFFAGGVDGLCIKIGMADTAFTELGFYVGLVAYVGTFVLGHANTCLGRRSMNYSKRNRRTNLH